MWYPSEEVSRTLKLEPNVHQTRLGFLVEARFANANKDTGEDDGMEKEEGMKLVGRAFSKILKIAEIRAKEKLYERTPPSPQALNGSSRASSPIHRANATLLDLSINLTI